MPQSRLDVDDVQRAALEDVDSVVALTEQLVQVPSRGGIDSYDKVLRVVSAWLKSRALTPVALVSPDGELVGITCEVVGDAPGPCWVLDACVDTAPFGDESRWSDSPTSGVIVDGWLHGRGAADSKAGVAIFCHVAARLLSLRHRLRGSIALLFDADEHTGRFGGARGFFGDREPSDIGGVLIGYPGLEKLIVGSRGVLRARIEVGGVAGHSGGRSTEANAVEKAVDLVKALNELRLQDEATPGFPLTPKLTVTAINGGEGFSTVPDLCVVNVDVRVTPVFAAEAAKDLLLATVAQVDDRWPATPATNLTIEQNWPAYALRGDDPLRLAMLGAAKDMGLGVEPAISGPSNIGNYIAGLGVPATAGFGVAYEGLHGTDERIDLATIPTVEAVYLAAALRLLDA